MRSNGTKLLRGQRITTNCLISIKKQTYIKVIQSLNYLFKLCNNTNCLSSPEKMMKIYRILLFIVIAFQKQHQIEWKNKI